MENEHSQNEELIYEWPCTHQLAPIIPTLTSLSLPTPISSFYQQSCYIYTLFFLNKDIFAPVVNEDQDLPEIASLNNKQWSKEIAKYMLNTTY